MIEHWPNYQIDKPGVYINTNSTFKEDYICAEGLCWASQIPCIPARYTSYALEQRALYIRGVPFIWSTVMCASLFSMFGRVTGCPCVTDSISGDRFRWLVMSTADEARAIVERARDMAIDLGGLTIEVSHYPGDQVRRRDYCPILPPQPTDGSRAIGTPPGLMQRFDPAISRPNTDMTISDVGVFTEPYIDHTLSQPSLLQPSLWEAKAGQQNLSQVGEVRHSNPIIGKSGTRILHSTTLSQAVYSTERNKLADSVSLSQQIPVRWTPPDCKYSGPSVLDAKGCVSDTSETVQTSPVKAIGVIVERSTATLNNEVPIQRSITKQQETQAPQASSQLETRTGTQIIPSNQSPGLSWAAIAGCPFKDSLVIDLRPRGMSGTENTLSIPSTKTSSQIQVPSKVESAEPKDAQMRVVFLLDIPNNITYENVSDAIHEGPLHSIRFGINGDNNSRFSGVVFQHSGDAQRFYAALQLNEAEKLRRFRWNVKSAMGPPFPADEIINAMTFKEEDPSACLATRRLTLVRSQLFSQYSEIQLEDLFSKVVRREFIQKIFLYNSGNATVIFAGVQEAITVKKHLEEMERKAGRGNGVPPIFKGLSIFFSKDPCQQQIRFISSVDTRKRSRFN